MAKHSTPSADGIRDPILAKHAVSEFGFSWKWLRTRIESGQVRSRKIGRYLVVDRGDIKRSYNVTPDDLALVRKAQQAHRERMTRSRGKK